MVSRRAREQSRILRSDGAGPGGMLWTILTAAASRLFRAQMMSFSRRMEEKRPMRRQPDDHHFWSRIMLAVMTGGFLLVAWLATKALFSFLQEAPIP
jgi:hypothetical protein